MNIPSPIKFAVVGYGYIGKRHAAIIAARSNSELVAICSPQYSKKELENDFSDLPFFDTLDALIDSNIEVDVLCICTPNNLHVSQAKKAIGNGMHALVEKPLGLNSKDCESLIALAKEKEKKVFCVMQNRYSPTVKWLHKIMAENRLGEVQLVQVNCFWNRDDQYYTQSEWKGELEKDGGPLFTQFSHFVDILYGLFGEIESISGSFKNLNHKTSTEFEDTGLVHFSFIKGGIGSINYSTAVWNKNFESSITIIGTKGTIKVGGQYMDKLQYCDVENYEVPEIPPANPPNDYGTYKGSAANHHYVFENIESVLNSGSEMTTNAEDGLKVVQMIEEIYSVRSRQELLLELAKEKTPATN